MFLPGESHGQRSLLGYSPRGHRSQIRLRDQTTTTTSVNFWLFLFCLCFYQTFQAARCRHPDVAASDPATAESLSFFLRTWDNLIKCTLYTHLLAFLQNPGGESRHCPSLGSVAPPHCDGLAGSPSPASTAPASAQGSGQAGL